MYKTYSLYATFHKPVEHHLIDKVAEINKRNERIVSITSIKDTIIVVVEELQWA